MSSDDETVVLIWWWMQFLNNENERDHWVHPINKKRIDENTLRQYIAELRTDGTKFRNFTRLTIDSFDYLLNLIGDKIRKQDTNWRKSITPEERLFITLRFLATGERFKSFHYYFRIGESTIGKIVIETCQAIWDNLSPIYMKAPTEQEEWIRIADKFNNLWNFPNCLGAVDGKHIRIESPKHSGSSFYNYKNFHSIILQAVVDADAKFIFIDVGDYGRNSDSGVFGQSSFGKLFFKNRLNLPSPRKVTETNERKLPFVFIGDEAYALTVNFMRPFPRKDLNSQKRIFNYRLSRARRLVECAFGMLTKRFRIFEGIFLINPEKVALVTMACCALHNMIREKEGTLAEIHEEFLHQFTTENEIYETNSSRPTNAAFAIRKKFLEYFSNEGKISWQDKYALT